MPMRRFVRSFSMFIQTIARSSVLVLILVSTSCSKKDASSTTPPAATETTVGHAPKDVKPGSHEDWCEEHAVPESQCTLCNPTLVAAFKATNDWCEEHGVPESHCKKCNPDLKIVRPPKAN
jgi:hypothetical protein